MFDSNAVEFDTFIDIIKKSGTSAFFKSIISQLKPENDIKKILNNQVCLQEALSLIKSMNISILDDTNFYYLYKKIEDLFFYLNNNDFLVIKNFLYYLNQIRNILNNQKSFLNLQEFISNIDPHYEFYKKLDKIFDEVGFIKDDATVRLLSVRVEILKERKNIFDVLNNMLNSSKAKFFVADKIITERWSRFLLLCKPCYKQYFEGILHDTSGSGQTYFVEPLSILNLNNRYRELKIQEEDEIKNIFDNLNKDIRQIYLSLKETIGFYEKFIYYLSLAVFFKDYQITFPVFTERINFDGIHHPLIFLKKPDNSVPIDFLMQENSYLAVLTGPNAGGKTAAIKSIGLNCLIAKCGLPLFGLYAEIKNFESLLCDIGDNQSILNDLSSFVSHLVNINKIIDYANGNALVIMDEPGTSTDPRKGVALSIAIIQELINRKTRVLVATHFEELKEMAILNNNAVIFAVDYDFENMIPKYNLLSGLSGDSSPFIIAEKYKLKKYIIEMAKKIYDKNYTESQKTLDELKLLQYEYKKKNNLIDSFLKEVEDLYNISKKKLNNIDLEIRQRKEEILQDALVYLDRSKKYYNKKQHNVNIAMINKDTDEVITQLETLKNSHNYIRDVLKGDQIFLANYNKNIEVLDVYENKVLINMDNKKIFMDKRDLIGRKVKKTISKVLDAQESISREQFPEIKLIGKRVEEAVDILEKYIDQMLLAGISKFYIIHGRGTGNLRKGVHDFLKRYKAIKSFQMAPFEKGGNAVTIVNL